MASTAKLPVDNPAQMIPSPWTLPELTLTCADRLMIYHSALQRCVLDGQQPPHFKDLFPDDSVDWPESYRVGVS